MLTPLRCKRQTFRHVWFTEAAAKYPVCPKCRTSVSRANTIPLVWPCDVRPIGFHGWFSVDVTHLRREPILVLNVFVNETVECTEVDPRKFDLDRADLEDAIGDAGGFVTKEGQYPVNDTIRAAVLYAMGRDPYEGDIFGRITLTRLAEGEISFDEAAEVLKIDREELNRRFDAFDYTPTGKALEEMIETQDESLAYRREHAVLRRLIVGEISDAEAATLLGVDVAEVERRVGEVQYRTTEKGLALLARDLETAEGNESEYVPLPDADIDDGEPTVEGDTDAD